MVENSSYFCSLFKMIPTRTYRVSSHFHLVLVHNMLLKTIFKLPEEWNTLYQCPPYNDCIISRYSFLITCGGQKVTKFYKTKYGILSSLCTRDQLDLAQHMCESNEANDIGCQFSYARDVYFYQCCPQRVCM